MKWCEFIVVSVAFFGVVRSEIKIVPPLANREEIETKNVTQRIVGGLITTVSKHPYQVSMLTNDGDNIYVCGASIISRSWLLTAAHCMINIKSITIRVGSTKLYRGGTIYISTFYKIHPSYNKYTNEYDVAVVKVDKDIVLNSFTVKIVSLADAGSTVSKGTNTTVSGWGTTSEGGAISDTLRSVTVPVIERSECNALYKKINQVITDRMICAGFSQGRKDSCQGDSGGPLVLANGKQVGIVSFGHGCAMAGYPGVYCSVASVRTWIKTTTGI